MVAAIVNAVIAVIKGAAFIFTGNVAMFAETMHSLGDAANQFFVFTGSALSKRAPTERFPGGFGRLVHLVLLGAVLIVGIMAYETIVEGYKHIIHPTESKGLLINVIILAAATCLEASVLFKAMKEILHETDTKATGFDILAKSFANVKRGKPATKLVFMEDSVATLGGILAIAAVLLSHYTPFHQAEGIASILIGIMMFLVVGKVFLDNARGVLGEADDEMEQRIGELVINDPDVKDVGEIAVIKEGDELHVELEIEINPAISFAEADDIKDRIEEKILAQRGVTDVTIELDEDDGVSNWGRHANEPR
nr:cation diffusion facilitator family transporter [Peribacillus kribbensis]